MAYCFDNAVTTFGAHLDAELEGVEGKTAAEIEKKRERILTKWLDMPQRFRAPMATARAKDIERQFTVQGEVG